MTRVQTLNRPLVAVAVVMVVVVLIGFGVIVTRAVLTLCPILHARRPNTKVTIHTVEQAIAHYQADNLTPSQANLHADVPLACPPSIQALVDGHYLNRLPRDDWGHALLFTCPGLHDRDGADVVSAGPDGRFGTADDINSWGL